MYKYVKYVQDFRERFLWMYLVLDSGRDSLIFEEGKFTGCDVERYLI